MCTIRGNFPGGKPAGLLCVLLLAAGCAGTPRAVVSETAKGPDWVYNTAAVYPEERFVSAVGYGLDRESAEKNALGGLVSVFGQTIQGETTATYTYSQALVSGLIDMGERSEIDSAVKTSFAMDTLVDAEIADRWVDNKDTHYAVAIMDRSGCELLYRGLIGTNEGIIRNLTDIPGEDRNSLEAYARYDLAATVADANAVFRNVLSVLNPASAIVSRDGLRTGEYYRLQAREIVQNIPVEVRVDRDVAGRIGAAFARVFSDTGFRTGGASSRYVLDVAFSLPEVELPQNQNKFVRYVIDANLRDTATGQVLFPYNINGREGHATLLEAENRAIRAAEEKIRSSYSEALASYLTRISPKTGA
ncbi:MAG: LPP20 family lipoprotein [Spirochaetaceae bacterium]|jgi:hypothetical protein|nr:LPP20 family lipoprotein [Spirochaetaceae bacterium]